MYHWGHKAVWQLDGIKRNSEVKCTSTWMDLSLHYFLKKEGMIFRYMHVPNLIHFFMRFELLLLLGIVNLPWLHIISFGKSDLNSFGIYSKVLLLDHRELLFVLFLSCASICVFVWELMCREPENNLSCQILRNTFFR